MICLFHCITFFGQGRSVCCLQLSHLDPTHSGKMEIAVDLVTDLAEKLRSDAKRLEDEKGNIRRSIETLEEMIKSGNASSLTEAQRADAVCNLQRAFRLSDTVQVSVNPMERDDHQIKANCQVNHLLDTLEKEVKRNPNGSKLRVLSYMNACCSNQISGVGPDQVFAAVIVGCTLDDQKIAKRRIERLMEVVGGI